jgi:4-amino-4-deoxy-L-arabinose transferase-like glycosyltransferase
VLEAVADRTADVEETVSAVPAVPIRDRFFSGPAIVCYIALAKLAIHLYAARSYGYFADELYFLACSRHLEWGYVDQPPLIALIVGIERLLFGDSLQSIRLFAALAGAGTVLIAGCIARELGGKRFAQALAAVAVLVAGVCLAMNHYISMNAFEPPAWAGCALILIRIIKTGNQKLWLWFGLIAGIALENKYGIVFFATGVVAGLLLTHHRSLFLKPWIWLGGLLAFLIFLPNLVWNIERRFPFFELLANVRTSGRNVPLTHLQFLGQVAMHMNPVAAPLVLAGLWFLFVHPQGRRFRVLGWASLVLLAFIMFSSNGRPYYVAPAYPMLFGAGGVAMEGWLSRRRLQWLKPAYVSLLLIAGAIGAPLAIPVLSPENYLRYSRRLHLVPPPFETDKLGPFPQFYADMFGWEEMTAEVARVYNSLPPNVRPKTAILGSTFSQAGAIDLFGPKLGLPNAIGINQSYFFWGPRDYTGESVVVMGLSREELEGYFNSIENVGMVSHPYSMPYEHFPIYYCRQPKMPLAQMWPKLKRWS